MDCHAKLFRGLWDFELRSSHLHSKNFTPLRYPLPQATSILTVTSNHLDRCAKGAQEGAPNGQSWKLLHIATGCCWKRCCPLPRP